MRAEVIAVSPVVLSTLCRLRVGNFVMGGRDSDNLQASCLMFLPDNADEKSANLMLSLQLCVNRAA